MKTLLLFVLVTCLLSACDNNPLVTKESTTKEKEEKKDKDADDSDYDDKDDKTGNDRKVNSDDESDEDEEDGNDTKRVKDDGDDREQGGWTRAQREQYVGECETEARKRLKGTAAASYCECMQGKIEKKYNMSFAEANKITAEDLSTPEAKADIQACLEN